MRKICSAITGLSLLLILAPSPADALSFGHLPCRQDTLRSRALCVRKNAQQQAAELRAEVQLRCGEFSGNDFRRCLRYGAKQTRDYRPENYRWRLLRSVKRLRVYNRIGGTRKTQPGDYREAIRICKNTHSVLQDRRDCIRQAREDLLRSLQ